MLLDQYLSEQSSSLNSDRSQFQFAIEDISDGVDVRHVTLFVVAANDLTVPVKKSGMSFSFSNIHHTLGIEWRNNTWGLA